MRKPYKKIKVNNSEVSLIGNHHWKEIKYTEDEDDPKGDLLPYFNFLGEKCFLHEYMRIDNNNPFRDHGFDGYTSDSFFSGTLIKFSNCAEAVQVTTYIG